MDSTTPPAADKDGHTVAATIMTTLIFVGLIVGLYSECHRRLSENIARDQIIQMERGIMADAELRQKCMNDPVFQKCEEKRSTKIVHYLGLYMKAYNSAPKRLRPYMRMPEIGKDYCNEIFNSCMVTNSMGRIDFATSTEWQSTHSGDTKKDDHRGDWVTLPTNTGVYQVCMSSGYCLSTK